MPTYFEYLTMRLIEVIGLVLTCVLAVVFIYLFGILFPVFSQQFAGILISITGCFGIGYFMRGLFERD